MTHDQSPTEALAEFASGLGFSSIPQATVEHAKLVILDTLGCALFGVSLPWAEILFDAVVKEGGNPQASLWGTSQKVSAPQAALVNATAVHSFEFDDVHMGGMIHVGALCLGAALSLGERDDVDGRQLLAAFVAGCEVGARVGRAVGTAHFRAGFHPQGTVGVFAAAAAAGRVLDLGPATMRDALGLAGSQAAGLMAAQEGSMAKRLHAGLACQNGVRSAELAAAGFSGIPDVFEANFGGFLSTMGGGSTNVAELVHGLGTNWETDAVGFKPFASCAAAQSSIEVARLLRVRMLAGRSSPRRVTVHCSTHAAVHCGWAYKPAGVTAAQMNIAYGVACMLLYGDVSADRFSAAAIEDPITVELASRITVKGDDAIDALGPDHRYGVRVEVLTDDDVTLHGAADDRPGGPTQPLPAAAIIDKFLGLAEPRVGDATARRIRSQVERLEDLDNVRDLVALLSTGTPATSTLPLSTAIGDTRAAQRRS